MPFDCRHRQRFGQDACRTSCAAAPVFSAEYVAEPGAEPPPDPRVIDIAVLDMHHGWPNLGHGAIVSAMQNAVCDLVQPLVHGGLRFRVLSYDVRRAHAIPEPPGGRHALYIGTGGPGHLDPALNDGTTEGSQGILENPAWERPLFALFDAIRADDSAALLAVCHTFGVMCRWLGVADAVLRGPEKGGKSTGVVENVLTGAALAHPWFARFSEGLPDRRHFRILDNRLYDLVPTVVPASLGVTPLAYETDPDGPAGEALTMCEVARAADGVMPRILGVNHHPEIINRPRLLVVLDRMLERGAVSSEWYEERRRTLTAPVADEWGDRLLNVSSSYTFMGPLRYHLYRLARRKAEELGLRLAVDEAMLSIAYGFQPAAR